MESYKEEKFLYLFVSRKNEAMLCAQYQSNAEKTLGMRIFGTITQFRDLFVQLMIYATKEHYTLIIDEFQEFDSVISSIFSDIQNLWDQYKDEAKINFIACGSIYSIRTFIRPANFQNRPTAFFCKRY